MYLGEGHLSGPAGRLTRGLRGQEATAFRHHAGLVGAATSGWGRGRASREPSAVRHHTLTDMAPAPRVWQALALTGCLAVE